MSRFNVNPQQILATYQQLHNDARAANEERYEQILTELRTSREGVAGMYGQIEALMDTVGQTELSDIRQDTIRQQDRAEQDLVSRGLGNTTIRQSVQRGIGEDAQRARQRSREGTARQQADVIQAAAQTEERFGNAIAGAIERRTDAYPDQGQLNNLLQQLGQAETAGGGTTTIGPGSSNFGAAFRGTSSGGGGGSGGASRDPFSRTVRGSGSSSFGSGYQGSGSGGGGTGSGARAIRNSTTPGGGSGGGNVSSFGPGSPSFESLFAGQDVYSGGDVIGTYGGNQTVNLADDLNLIGADGELDPNRFPSELGGMANAATGGGLGDGGGDTGSREITVYGGNRSTIGQTRTITVPVEDLGSNGGFKDAATYRRYVPTGFSTHKSF